MLIWNILFYGIWILSLVVGLIFYFLNWYEDKKHKKGS